MNLNRKLRKKLGGQANIWGGHGPPRPPLESTLNRFLKAVSLISTDVFLWLTYQNLDKPENFWCNIPNWGGAIASPLATRLH